MITNSFVIRSERYHPTILRENKSMMEAKYSQSSFAQIYGYPLDSAHLLQTADSISWDTQANDASSSWLPYIFSLSFMILATVF